MEGVHCGEGGQLFRQFNKRGPNKNGRVDWESPNKIWGNERNVQNLISEGAFVTEEYLASTC